MVDIDEDITGPHHLKFCLAPSNTPATVLIPEDAEGDELEIRPQAQVIAENMAENIENHGGCSLIVDYGDVKCDRHTLRAFKNHQLANPLSEPGNSDLTSNVDFSHLEKVFTQHRVATFGPVTQRHFLTAMGIDVRKQVLLKKASAEQAKNIESSYRMLTHSSEMGNCFKFFTAIQGNEKPPGF
ncbi:Hypothetical predicted protein [Paramuricea clavata]|uniref:Protein arginine methyltransferase NDUFAF7 n=2 Tax=Paramuricea clavata TaxID=317549 RepID=A0A6S7JDZ3_PARCT|nr:Hypothetical predicted protein [Paramuricea clavata]